METAESYRTSVLPDLSGRGATAARFLVVAGPVALLGAQLAATLQSGSGAEEMLTRAAAPLMLAWAAVLFLVTRQRTHVAAWTGLVAVTLQVTLLEGVAQTWLPLLAQAVGFVAFAVALWQQDWVPRFVPALLVVFPVVDAVAPAQGGLLATAAFASFVAAALALSVSMKPTVARQSAAPVFCGHRRTCGSGATCRVATGRPAPQRFVAPLV